MTDTPTVEMEVVTPGDELPCHPKNILKVESRPPATVPEHNDFVHVWFVEYDGDLPESPLDPNWVWGDGENWEEADLVPDPQADNETDP